MKELLIYLTIFLSVAFMFTPAGPKIDIFLLYDVPKSAEGVAYHLWAHVGNILLFHVIQTDARRRPRFYRAMFWFQVADMIDYLVTYNEAWITINGERVLTMNIIGALVCGWYLYKDWKEKR